jgi:cyclophilin family peptidyl-prolyl cis-trans isomerase
VTARTKPVQHPKGRLAVFVVLVGVVFGACTATEESSEADVLAPTIQSTVALSAAELEALENVPDAVRTALLAPTACGGTAPTSFPQMQFDAPIDQGISGSLTAVIHTSCGDITIDLDPSVSPQSVNSFVFLANEGYFDGQVIHRVVTDFVFQGGDPTATGIGGPGYTIVDEFPPVGTEYPVGTVAMAKSGAPNSTGSQFFVVLADSPHLGSQEGLMFNVLGQVTEGLAVLEAINDLEVGGAGSVLSLYLEGVEITP